MAGPFGEMIIKKHIVIKKGITKQPKSSKSSKKSVSLACHCPSCWMSLSCCDGGPPAKFGVCLFLIDREKYKISIMSAKRSVMKMLPGMFSKWTKIADKNPAIKQTIVFMLTYLSY